MSSPTGGAEEPTEPWQRPHQYPPYGYPPPGYYRPDHPKATTALVVGIVGLVVCGGIISPWAWIEGRRAVREIDASGGAYGGRGVAQAGYILGIIGTILLAVYVLAFVAWLLLVVVMGLAAVSTSP
ncbi:MAG TPA: DUF4190 domain-containing protein [Nocardioidaceae bacterium]|nr:DUF4190 domain-containing protein [Nocardioidaceae bacterium]